MTDTPKPDRPVMISVNGVGKSFKLPHEKTTSIKGAVINSWRKRRTYEIQTALKNISFEVPKGEFLGIVGRNGSGKSTLLKLLAGIYTPNKGTIDVKGSLTPFIELGVGFNPELTGRENIFLNGALLGFSRKEMAAMYQEIVDFAELERFMDQKLKNYSSGMQVRLAFSIAIQARTDILLIDEVLAVGDAIFQQKCYDYFDKLKNSDTTVVFISHDMGAIQAFCDRAILIDDSKVVMEGQPVEVTQKYSQILAADSKVKYTETKLQHTGVGTAEILGASILDNSGKAVKSIEEGEPFTVRIEYKANKTIEDPVFGVGIMGEKGNSLIGPNTKEAKVHTGTIKKGKGRFEVSFKNNILAPGSYRIRGAIFNTSNTVPYDFVEHLHVLTITGKKRYGEVVLDAEWDVK